MTGQGDSPASPDLAGRVPLLNGQHKSLPELVAQIVAQSDDLLPAERSGMHNPWGVASRFTDPWQFLNLCENPAIIAQMRPVLGDDIILWDSELFLTGADYERIAPLDAEGQYWPVEPLVGAVVVVAPEDPFRLLACMRQDRVCVDLDLGAYRDRPVLVIRYMSARSHYVRDPDHPAHRRCMEEQVLINYANRPLWLVSGKNHGQNNLVTGFAPPVPTWVKTPDPIQ